MITQEELKTKLNYDPDTGIFTHKKRYGGVAIGSIAGGPGAWGMRIMVCGTHYASHRLAWLYMTGSFPADQIDHINRNPRDNRFCNLREATNTQNQRNCGLRVDNTSGFKGVYRPKGRKKFEAYSYCEGKKKRLGYFDTALEASEAYEAYAKEHFGEFYSATGLPNISWMC